ncbi:Recombination helicase AddA [Alkaliphilus metalliredigens QYMF]|uniref:ATP-dependent helicase/nuclease subunit A n=1 Tax=Alkaliphilus metalliredigens (strain QYMF) TaxID=293826 RepID=ADDA_ALKMQ|nr:helicase-exonuclease AddAB subunit AddA [Alkaliphilus metalliredigens]A6TVN2.1 RecName: Full=ATP-dependent helicase/nuclease subunit A; AltName: Full=ATP-dependent helicase/nuclease AddA; AltName: Full=DNA 3'-5' helicase AddA [Alkaliphilus metalliredigens QYMF]ABR50250.1 Recombination helicase AddA [Alkaliphilus metalliredigens QYMF]
MKNWTTEQQAAIDARGSNLLISAAAGSGKTAVLVERIIQIILKDKIDIDRLLIVTFTNAAAGEMRERIAGAIMEEMERKTEQEAHLRRQINLLNRASITTIHSFCIDVVRRHFHIIDVDPGFRIGDITETSIMRLEALEELFEEEYQGAHETFFRLVEAFGGTKEDRPLQDLVLKVYGFIQSQPYPEVWLKEKVGDFSLSIEDFDESLWIKTIKSRIEIQLKGAMDLLNNALSIAQEPGGPEVYEEAILSDLGQISELYDSLTLPITSFYEHLNHINHARLKPSKESDPVLKEESKNLRDKAKGIIKDIKDNIFTVSPEAYVEDLNKLHPLMDYLYQLVTGFTSRYAQKKADRGIVDFNDLEHYGLEILANELVAQEYQQRFEYIFVDEYQDSNIVQETLIQSIKRKDNLFMVGDVKQSIYRFRLADPSLFIEKYETFGEKEGDINRRIDLAKNFRSRGEVLAGVNYLFKYIMSKELGEIGYDHRAALYQGASFESIKEPSIEVNLIEKNMEIDEDIEEELQELADIEVEARIIAKRIKDLLNEEIYDEKNEVYRRLEFKDIVVLLRTTKNWAQSFLEAFIREGIPAYADANTGYFEAIEVGMFLNLLKVIDNKRQDIPLISVMRSPIGEFTTAELIDIRINDKNGTYYDAIEKYIEKNEDALKDKLVSFIEKLNKWGNEARYIKIDQFIWKLLMDTGFYYYVGAMPGGLQRQANLRILFDRASQFEKTSIKGLFNFIKFIEKLQGSKGDMGAAKILGENDNVVRIMSIHKSKGLEFPVVIAAGMGKNFNLRDTSADVLLHKDLGLGPKFVDSNLRTYRDSIAKLAMKDQIKIESLSEEMRILYVAFTRPKDKLIIVGSLRKIDRLVTNWNQADNIYSLMNAKSYLDWIGAALIKHPHGEVLRELGDFEFNELKYKAEDSKWTVNILGRQAVVLEEHEKRLKEEEYKEKLTHFNREDFSPHRHTEHKEEIDNRLNWQYPYPQATVIPSKLSVSDIKKANMGEMDSIVHQIPTLVKTPKFMEGKKALTAAERGTIIHFVLQHLALNQVGSEEEISQQIDLMVARELITEEEAQVVNVGKIVNYFKSEIGKRMLGAEKVYRESPFIIEKSAKDVIHGLSENLEEKLLVQGVIDCYFEEMDGLVLVDYKNDIVLNGDTASIMTRYDVQLMMYAEALERITGKQVKETYLYLFDVDQGVKR